MRGKPESNPKLDQAPSFEGNFLIKIKLNKIKIKIAAKVPIKQKKKGSKLELKVLLKINNQTTLVMTRIAFQNCCKLKTGFY